MFSSKKSVLAVMLCATLWSLGGLFIKLVDWPPFAIAGVRSLIASLILLAFIRKPRFNFTFPQVAAAVSYAATMLLYVAANKTTTAANAILLQYSAPVFAAFFGWFMLSERPSIEQWVSLVFVIGGMAVFFMDRLSPGNALGNGLAVASGVTFAFFSVFMRMQKDGSPIESMLLAHWIVVLVALPFILAGPRLSTGPATLASLAVLGIFQTGIASILFAVGIKGVTAIQSMLLAGLEPILNPVWVLLATGERPGPNALVGGSVILIAVTASSMVTVRKARRQAALGADQQA
jgi:drug/metabolite transporter (DMT)-like permease